MKNQFTTFEGNIIWIEKEDSYENYFIEDKNENSLANITIDCNIGNESRQIFQINTQSTIAGLLTILAICLLEANRKLIINNSIISHRSVIWIERLLQSGGYGFKITDQNGIDIIKNTVESKINSGEITQIIIENNSINFEWVNNNRKQWKNKGFVKPAYRYYKNVDIL
jgi:hypothetical protein